MIRQRIKAGLKRSVAQGVKLGRPKIDGATERKVRKQLAKGVGILKVARSLGIGAGTVQRICHVSEYARRSGCSPAMDKNPRAIGTPAATNRPQNPSNSGSAAMSPGLDQPSMQWNEVGYR